MRERERSEPMSHRRDNQREWIAGGAGDTYGSMKTSNAGVARATAQSSHVICQACHMGQAPIVLRVRVTIRTERSKSAA